MNRRSFIAASMAVGGTMSLSGCELLYPSATLRYRMSVEVDTPEGLKTGSSVLEVMIKSGPKILNSNGISYHLKGEAITVDLLGGLTLFALLRGVEQGSPPDYHADLFRSLLIAGVPTVPSMPRRYGPEEWEDVFRDANELKPMMVIPPRLKRWPNRVEPGIIVRYPLLVTFADIANPKTVALVDPDDLSASFGPGTKLRRITLQITDDPVTTGIRKRLGWLEEVGRSRATLIPDPPQLLKDTLPIQLVASSDFSTELYK